MNHISMSSVFAMLIVSLLTPPVFGEEPALPYQYSNEWSLVSAPPPAGPYRPINIDPRVPGPGTVTELPLLPLQPEDKPADTPSNDGAATTGSTDSSADQSINKSEEVEQEFSASIPGAAPAAGIPVLSDEATSPADSAKALNTSPEPSIKEAEISKPNVGRKGAMSPMPVPAYGYGRRIPPQTPAYNYPPPGYPYQPMYQGNRSISPPGYYNPVERDAELEVPPPPVYDGMYGSQPYQGGGW